MTSEALSTTRQDVSTSVERLLAWNETYQKQVESVAIRIAELGMLTESCTSEYTQVVDKSASLARAAQDVEIIFANIEDEAEQLTKIVEELSAVLRPGLGRLPNIDQNIVVHVKMLARSLAEHQRLVASALAKNALSIRNSLQTVSGKLEAIAAAAKDQVTTLDHALTPSIENHKGLSDRQLSALSESLAEKVVPISSNG